MNRRISTFFFPFMSHIKLHIHICLKSNAWIGDKDYIVKFSEYIIQYFLHVKMYPAISRCIYYTTLK